MDLEIFLLQGAMSPVTPHREQDLARGLPGESPCNPASKHRRKLKIEQYRAPQPQLPRSCENHSVQAEFEHSQARVAKNAKGLPLPPGLRGFAWANDIQVNLEAPNKAKKGCLDYARRYWSSEVGAALPDDQDTDPDEYIFPRVYESPTVRGESEES